MRLAAEQRAFEDAKRKKKEAEAREKAEEERA